MKKILQMDPEFKRLSVPLSSEEELKLEKSLIREGCLEPISVWRGCILDGQPERKPSSGHAVKELRS